MFQSYGIRISIIFLPGGDQQAGTQEATVGEGRDRGIEGIERYGRFGLRHNLCTGNIELEVR